MKKIYSKPSTEVLHVQTSNLMIVTSKFDSGMDGEQLSKKDNDWNIWDDDVEY